MKRKVLKTAIILSTALTLSGLCGCGSDSSTAVAESESESEPVAGKGVAGEKYKADFNGHTYEFIDEEDHGDLPVFNGHAYEFIANPVSWTEARKYCDSVGGHLLTITSPEEQKFIENTFSGKMFWIGAYSNGVYGGDIYDWRWVTGEEWYYENFTDGEPSNSDGEEWFGCIWKKMKWNDLREGDPGNRLDGFVCEFDDLPDLFEADGSINPMSDPPEMEEFDSEVDNEWEKALKESTKEDPFIKDLGDGRYAIQSHWRGVQIKYPISYVAGEDGDALYVYDGDSMYIYARNITAAAEDYKGSLASFCAARAEEQVVEDFTRLYGAPTNMDGVKREGGDGKNRICSIRGNMWNGNADMAFSSKVVISGKKNNFLVLYTVFWRYGDDEARSHTGNIKVTSWGKGDMYG